MSTEIPKPSDHELRVHVAEAVRGFFTDPQVADAIVNQALTKRPKGWSRRSNAPYYNETAGEQLQHVADKMIADHTDQIFFYKDFAGMSHTTLYLRINQAMRFLVEKMDTSDLRYARWHRQIDVTREYGVGVRISWKDTFRLTQKVSLANASPIPLQPSAVIPKDEAKIPLWQQEIDKFLENPKQGKLHIERLALSEEQVTELKRSLSNCKSIIHVIRPNEIKIIKVQQ